jgi:FixJ family two-component response regulator
MNHGADSFCKTNASRRPEFIKSESEPILHAETHLNISCVVTDYAMPGMTGAQLAASIRVKKPRMPIIIASGYAEVPEAISQYPRLQKPFSANALLAVVVEAPTPLKPEVIDFPLPNRTT